MGAGGVGATEAVDRVKRFTAFAESTVLSADVHNRRVGVLGTHSSAVAGRGFIGAAVGGAGAHGEAL